MSTRAARWYASAMATTNLLVALMLLAMFAVNSAYGGANLFVAMFAPLASTAFAIISIMWAVAACIWRDRVGSGAPSGLRTASSSGYVRSSCTSVAHASGQPAVIA